jgi:hypothetical protein
VYPIRTVALSGSTRVLECEKPRTSREVRGVLESVKNDLQLMAGVQ